MNSAPFPVLETWFWNRTHSPVALMGSEFSITVIGTEVSPCLVITTVALSAPSPTVYSSVEKERMGTGAGVGAELGQNGEEEKRKEGRKVDKE